MRPRTAAVVGGGLAGLACAVALQDAGLDVSVFDKGHRPGGRIASRRLDGASFDHGAQFATARGADFQASLDEMEAAGAAAVWPAASGCARRWVGVPGMSAMTAHLVAKLARPPVQACHVAGLQRSPDGWRLRHFPASEIAPGAVANEGGELAGPFDAVMVALPGPQAASLLAPVPHRFAEAAAAARYAPCWAVCAIFAEPVALPDTRRSEAGVIGWIARESSRPGRAAKPERFMIHASAEWSQAHLEADEEFVRSTLLAELGVGDPVAASAHRWRYAQVETALGEPCLWDAAMGLGVCGDWCIGGRVEAAWDSGRALAASVVAT